MSVFRSPMDASAFRQSESDVAPPHHRIGMCASLERRINVMTRKEKVFDGGSPFATHAKENYNAKHRQNESYQVLVLAGRSFPDACIPRDV